MERKSLFRRKTIIIGIIIGALLLSIAALFIKQSIKDAYINDDYSVVYIDPAYKEPVAAEGVELTTMEISCGYACIEMISNWIGQPVTEQELLAQNNGRISTSTGSGFRGEMEKQFPQLVTTAHTYLKNTELLEMVYDSLERGTPVPVELAALYDDGEKSYWTLHYVVVTQMDVLKDRITVLDPYGYEQDYTIADFLKATRYESYENMELHLRLAFLAGFFDKNTVFIMSR